MQNDTWSKMIQYNFSIDDVVYDVSYSNCMRILKSAIFEERLNQNRADVSFFLYFDAP